MISRETFDFADRKCVGRLNSICKDYPIEVILSSSWRFSGVDYCRKYLETAGLESHVHIAGTTQTEVFQHREKDILQYITDHPDCAGYIVFDDGSMPHLAGHMIQTNPFRGWDEERDRYARLLLDNQKQKMQSI